jgi:hypothetical protein
MFSENVLKVCLVEQWVSTGGCLHELTIALKQEQGAIY